jgi:hypothetical protein
LKSRAWCQSRKSESLFDHVVGAGEQRRRDFNARCLRGPEADDELERRRLSDRQIGGQCAPQNLAGVNAALPIGIRDVRIVTDQSASRRKVAILLDRRDRCCGHPCDEVFAMH